MELKLSDSFLQQVEDPELELKVKVYNINPGKNPELLEHCQRLKEYMIFVEKYASMPLRWTSQPLWNAPWTSASARAYLRIFFQNTERRRSP